MSLQTFTDSYITAALWSSCDDNGVPLDRNYGPEDLSPEALVEIQRECADFYNANEEVWRDRYIWNGWPEDERAGHDFWLTRNHHGVGFWDRDWADEEGEDTGKRLTEMAHAYGESDLYVGDDGAPSRYTIPLHTR